MRKNDLTHKVNKVNTTTSRGYNLDPPKRIKSGSRLEFHRINRELEREKERYKERYTHKEKERKRLKISEDDYLKAHKSLKSPWLSRDQQEEQMRRHNFEETKARAHRETEEKNKKLDKESKG